MTATPAWTPRLQRTHYEPDPGTDPHPPAVHAGSTARPPAIGRPTPPGHTPTAVLAVRLAEVLRTALEVLDGRRPHTQLATAFGPRALRYWRAATGVQVRGAAPPRLVRVRIGRPQAHVAEVAAVVRFGSRHRAVAARFEHGADRVWRCTEIRLL